MVSVGIIPNPASGKDIRRLVAQALVVSNREKVNIVSRMLVGLHATGVSEIQVMPDLFGIGVQSVNQLRNLLPELGELVKVLDMDLSNSALDSMRAAEMMRDSGVNCIIVLGGDGTSRVVSKGCGNVPLLPVSTGTNNVVPYFVEGTIAGLCAGYIAGIKADQREVLCNRSKRIEVWLNGQMADIALVDLAVIAGGFAGSKAVWDSSDLRQVAVTRASPTSIGLSSMVGMTNPISLDDDFGGLVQVNDASDDQKTVSVPLGPGLIEQISISEVKKMAIDQAYPVVDERPLVLSLDGERELVLGEGDTVELIIKRNGPLIVDLNAVMCEAASRDYFVSV